MLPMRPNTHGSYGDSGEGLDIAERTFFFAFFHKKTLKKKRAQAARYLLRSRGGRLSSLCLPRSRPRPLQELQETRPFFFCLLSGSGEREHLLSRTTTPATAYKLVVQKYYKNLKLVVQNKALQKKPGSGDRERLFSCTTTCISLSRGSGISRRA